MKGFFLMVTMAVAMVTVESTPDVSQFSSPYGSLPSRPSECKECKKQTHCKSEVIVSEIDVPKDVSIPSVEAKEHIVYKQVPVPEYEIRNKVTTKLVRVPAHKVTFQKNYRERTPAKRMKVRKPLIKYNVTWIDVEVERLVTHEKPVSLDVTVDKVKRVPVISDNHEPIIVEKRRPVGKPKPEAKTVTVPNGIKRVPRDVYKKVKVPEITYSYCDTVKNIYVPDKCTGDTRSGGAEVELRQSPSFKREAGFASNLQPPSENNRFVRQPTQDAPGQIENVEAVREVQGEPNLFGARRFARAVSSYLTS